MDTPVLSKNQQRRTLSAKKNKKVTIKNVLASPYERYWPLVTSEDENAIHAVLKQHLTLLCQPRISTPWSELKSVPREQRKEYRKQHNKSDLLSIDRLLKFDMVIGANEVTKSLEADEISTVLLTSDAKPQMMVKHIIDLAVLRNVPTLVVAELRVILNKCVGFGGLAVGFKKNLNMDSKYWAIDQKVKELATNYPVPVNHINYARQQATLESNKMEIESNKSLSTKDSKESVISKSLYLYRTSTKYRCFVPQSSRNTEEVVHKMQVDSRGFISFGEEVNEKPVSENTDNVRSRKVSYKSLLIKRVRNNEDRGKKKIEMLKRKKK